MEKKSFIIYVDTAKQVDFLTDEEAGQLFKALFRYVSDGKEFVTDNRTLAIVFSAIKAQIDRDSKKYVEISNKAYIISVPLRKNSLLMRRESQQTCFWVFTATGAPSTR